MTRDEIKAMVINEGHSLSFKIYSKAFDKEMQQPPLVGVSKLQPSIHLSLTDECWEPGN